MRGYRAILEKEVLELWRTYWLVVTCGLFAVLGIVLAVLVRFEPTITRLFGVPDPELHIGRTSIADAAQSLVQVLWVAGPLAAVLLTSASVAGERRARTASFVLAKPVSRVAFVWAKFAAVAMVLGLATALTVLATFIYSSVLFAAQQVIPWVQLWLLAWLASLAYAAITLAASVTLPTPGGAAGAGLAVFAGLNLASTIVTLNHYLPSGLAEVGQALVLGELGPDVDPFRSVVASVGLVVVALGFAWLRFRQTDL